MRITGVGTVIVGARMRNGVFVKVVTDEPGLVGWGEATLEWKTHAVAGAVEDLVPLLVGQDPFRIEQLWQSMRRHHFWPPGIIGMSALSGVDQALHDIKAKSLGVPIYELLGGAVRDRIRLYDHHDYFRRSADPELERRVLDARPLNRVADPAEIAEVVCFLASDAASFLTGADWAVDGGLGARFA